jgi:hypothetical protein
LWRHRNDIVFKSTVPSTTIVLRKILSKAELWRVAGVFRARLAVEDKWRFRE